MKTKTYYLPKCCFVRDDGGGGYEVCHQETSEHCKHTPSGGKGGRQDGVTPCNRVIAHGETKVLAIEDARTALGLG